MLDKFKRYIDSKENPKRDISMIRYKVEDNFFNKLGY